MKRKIMPSRKSDIRDMYVEGMSMRAISQFFHHSFKTVQKIVNQDDFNNEGAKQKRAPRPAKLLFQVVSDAYETVSLIITSNLELSQWNSIFGDKVMTAALIDRLIHHSHFLVFSGTSYRLSQSIRHRQEKAGGEKKAA